MMNICVEKKNFFLLLSTLSIGLTVLTSLRNPGEKIFDVKNDEKIPLLFFFPCFFILFLSTSSSSVSGSDDMVDDEQLKLLLLFSVVHLSEQKQTF